MGSTKQIWIQLISISNIIIISTTTTFAQTTNEQSSDFIDVFGWVILAVILFFGYLFITRWLRRNNNPPNKYQQRESIRPKPTFAQSENHQNTKIEQRYTCSSCQRKGTKKDIAWYRSEQTGDIICEICLKNQKETNNQTKKTES